MYPTLSDILKDLFGINIPLPVQTFGLFLMFSFMAAYLYMYYELQRKKSLGIFQPTEMLVITGKKKGTESYLISAIVYFIVCYKLFYIIENYSFFSANPQTFLLST